MDRKNLDRYCADNIGLIHTVTRQGYGRLSQIGAATSYNDLFQEMSEVFVKAYDKFDESNGAKFSTYFTTCARNRINRLAEAFEVERLGLQIEEAKLDENGDAMRDENGEVVTVSRRVTGGTRSIEEMNDWLDDGENGIEEMIASDYATPEQIVETASVAGNIVRQLSPLAARIASMAIDPPEFIEREFEAAQAHAEYARSQGVPRRARGAINVAFVCSVMERVSGLPHSTIEAAKKEVFSVVEKNIR